MIPSSALHFHYLELIRFKNSSRVFWSSRNEPSIVDVMVLLLIFCTPLITMHMCLKSNDSVYSILAIYKHPPLTLPQ